VEDELTYRAGNSSVFKHHTMKEYRGEEVTFTLALVMGECSSCLYFQGKSSSILPRPVGPRAVLIIAITIN
jgi:hypothetical protein